VKSAKKGEGFMEKIKELLGGCIDYLKANPILAYIFIGVAALIVLVLLIAICKKIKHSNAKKHLAAQEAKRIADEEQKQAEVNANAEQERLAKEQAEKEAEEKRLAEEKAEQERLEKEKAEQEKAEIERVIAEKTAKEEAQKQAKAEKEVEDYALSETQEEKQSAVLYDELKDVEEEHDIWYDENETDRAARYSGKWLICRVLTDDDAADEMYFFELHASNGEKLLSSEEYTTYAGALRGIETHKNNILKNNFRITISKKGDYIFKLLSSKNMLLCMGENYPTRARCESAIESAKRFAKTAVIDENVQDHIVKVPAEEDAELAPLPDGYNGKWIISSRQEADNQTVYWFELFANNGEKLLSSEDYTSYIGAVNGIQTHKNNIEKGNFRISLTKRGDYIYKLLNGNGQLLCLGEHYKTKRRCQNAVESVKRFAKNSPVLTNPEHTK
jgi:uncharacterized protein YegP (UPF0339 family)